jgi:hypothetical protein
MRRNQIGVGAIEMQSYRVRVRVWGAALCVVFATTATFAQSTAEPKADGSAFKVGGSVQLEAARIVSDPTHWSTLRLSSELSANYRLSEDVRFRFLGRAATDAAASVEDSFYPKQVRRDQRHDLSVREAFVEFPIGNFGARFGRQFINWGEAVGVFVADVVNARDLREFLLQDVDQLRIGQWAARLDWQGEDKSAEIIWIPFPSYDRIGYFGGDYYPQLSNPRDTSVRVNDLTKPSHRLSNSNFGARGGFLKNGWDVAGFFYQSTDREVAFTRIFTPTQFAFTPTVGNRIRQTGVTASKDLEFAVLKLESVYTHGRTFPSTRPSSIEGLVKKNSFEWLLGLDVPVPDSEARVNLQAIQRSIQNADANLLVRKRDSYVSMQLIYPYAKWEGSLLGIQNVDRTEWLLRPKITYKASKNTRVSFGGDFFKGPAFGLLGQFEDRDRLYVRVKHNF